MMKKREKSSKKSASERPEGRSTVESTAMCNAGTHAVEDCQLDRSPPKQGKYEEEKRRKRLKSGGGKGLYIVGG